MSFKWSCCNAHNISVKFFHNSTPIKKGRDMWIFNDDVIIHLSSKKKQWRTGEIPDHLSSKKRKRRNARK